MPHWFSRYRPWGISRIGTVAACVVLAPCAFAAPADDLKILLEQGKHADAYRQALRTPGEIGNPAFDFYYGVAAINSGKASEGVLALERFLLNEPANLTARLELARGYYLLNDDGRARDEFDAVLATKPPADVARVVREYLAALNAREARHKTTYSASIELSGGRDSNVQSGVSDPNITLPIFGDITLTDSAVAKSDRFGNLLLSGRVSVPVRAHWSAFAQVSADLRQYREQDAYNQNTYSSAVGFAVNKADTLYRVTLGATQQTLDSARYRDTWTLGADLGYQLANGGVLALGTQAAVFSYAGDNAIRNSNYFSAQAGYRHVFAAGWRPEFDVSLSAAREDNTAGGHDSLSRDLWGARTGFNISPWASWTIALGANYLRSNYRAEDPLLLVTRRDNYYSVDVSASYAFTPAWSLRGEYLVSRNKSNLPLFEYKRRIGQVKLRYDFQ